MTTFLHEVVQPGEADLGEDAAHHARVKRLEPGNEVSITDGRGARGTGTIVSIGKRSLVVSVATVDQVERPSEIHLYVPIADKERMLWVAEKATELQVASWNPVMYERSKSVASRGEGEAFQRKVLARMVGALEQSGGAWLPAVGPPLTIAGLSREKGIVLERGGDPLGRMALAAPVHLAVGPEGGFTPEELTALLDAGWSAASFGEVTLRFETAAIGAVAIARALT